MKKINKNLTYDEISDKINISTQQVHKLEKEAFNKIFKRLCNMKLFTPVEVILGISSEFGISPDQSYNKLDVENKALLIKYANEDYGKNAEYEDVGEEFESIIDLFR